MGSHSESDEQQRLRFQIELEFVQCLANPNYLTFLAQRGYFKEQNFINYLKYLQYWKEPEYAKFLKYPMCLHFLNLLQYDAFRKKLNTVQCAKFIDDQQLLHWQQYTHKRGQMLQQAVEEIKKEEVNGSVAGSVSSSSVPVSIALLGPQPTSDLIGTSPLAPGSASGGIGSAKK